MSAIWESANCTRQFGIRQTGNRQFGMLPLCQVNIGIEKMLNRNFPSRDLNQRL
jgi:hypothetical protein